MRREVVNLVLSFWGDEGDVDAATQQGLLQVAGLLGGDGAIVCPVDEQMRRVVFAGVDRRTRILRKFRTRWRRATEQQSLWAEWAEVVVLIRAAAQLVILLKAGDVRRAAQVDHTRYTFGSHADGAKHCGEVTPRRVPHHEHALCVEVVFPRVCAQPMECCHHVSKLRRPDGML
eukprot:CAMPEP_0181174788 /NCGR_PEP_ID=MMETSP1096-20121128/3729_1 /TAXON_ID=156174 ORGANISM="Chrysochromulina ericina, Strain CCMP281" /NCGR_SAMPLE_ID=MMETSP1096 /ASSEMBLY_ACC=CAM_ASM_000453 /LENGTH=173 /DNA_ID=CAMNT_0023262725 /DNA_START=493 /DNA_END=1014 /DNA_ORIENTATION=+